MKLNEIIDTSYRERQTDFGLSDASRKAAKNNKITGICNFGTVRDKKSDPFLVSKTSRKPAHSLEKSDGYYAYIKYIVDNKIAEHNPYAPRVYNITIYKNKDGVEKYKIDMEKLESSVELTEEEIEMIYKKIFATSIETFTRFTLAMSLEQALEYNRDVIKDEKVKEIFDIIYNISREGKFGIDLHANNFMVRRTSVGPQIVIIDPLA